MAKYYFIIAGLPELSLDDHKLPFTVSEFLRETNPSLTKKDRKIINLFCLKYDNGNLLQQLEYPDYDPDIRGCVTLDEFLELIKRLKEEGIPTENKDIPPFYIDFIKIYLEAKERNEKQIIPWEDQLSAFYYNYAMKSKNDFIASWFELNLNINNMLAAVTARAYNWDRHKYIVGENEVANNLRTSNARDFGLSVQVDYWPEIQRISEETNLIVREKKIDQFKWNWLDEHSFFKYFEIEAIFSFIVKLDMLQRWTSLDKEAGEKSFRELIGTMKKGSDTALEEFKRNNIK